MGIGLLEKMIEYCDQMYSDYQCDECTGHNCTNKCKDCLDDIHFHTNRIRRSYDCEKLLYYYLCRYSYKYCSEIIYALEKIDSSRYPFFNILSLGCGGAADLMAFDCCTDGDDDIYYHGVDINTYWNDIHSKISEIYPHASFTTGFDVRTDIPSLRNEGYNVIIIEYLISYLYSQDSTVVIDLFDDLIEYVISNKPQNSPMLIIINDVDNDGLERGVFDGFSSKLQNKGYDIKVKKYRFNESSYYKGSTLHDSNNNLFDIPVSIKSEYCVAIKCKSAQLIIEID